MPTITYGLPAKHRHDNKGPNTDNKNDNTGNHTDNKG